MDEAYTKILDVLRAYYDGLYRCDTLLLARVFHPEARYCTVSGGEFLHLDMQTYLPIVAERTSPETRGEPYGYQVDSIDFAGPDTALARIRSTMWDRHFTDFLALIRLDGEWKIISKVFEFEPVDQRKPLRPAVSP